MAGKSVSKVVKAKRPVAIKTAKKRAAPRVDKSNSDNAYLKVFYGMMAEKKPILPDGFVETAEDQLNSSGAHAVNRRIAMAFLRRPFKEMAKKIRDERDTALAFANVAECIRVSAERYKELAEIMGVAEIRIGMALAQREDMQEILALAKAETGRTVQ